MFDNKCRSYRQRQENMRRAASALYFFVAVISTAGCERAEPLGRIHGRVTFQGAPVTEGLIVFNNTQKGVFMTAPLNKDGSYVVTSAAGLGLPLGQYRVMIAPPMDEPILGPNFEPPPIKPYPNIPTRFRDVKTSNLSLEVKEGDNVLDTDMKP
jgi:hypothetical protein